MTIRKLFPYATLLFLGMASASAAERFTYEAKAFRSALDAGKPILVDVAAPWCGECKAQKPVVAALAERPEFEDLIIFDVDFDTQKAALRELNVQRESTLVVYKNKAEVARAVGITRPEVIETLVKKAL